MASQNLSPIYLLVAILVISLSAGGKPNMNTTSIFAIFALLPFRLQIYNSSNKKTMLKYTTLSILSTASFFIFR